MRKLFSFVLLSVAMLMFSSVMAAQPKAKDIVGKWEIEPAYLSKVLGELPPDMSGNISCNFEFVNTSEATTNIAIVMQMPVDNSTNMVIDILCTLDCDWSYNDGVMHVEYKDINASLKDVRLVPENSEFAAFVSVFRSQAEAMLVSEIAKAFNNVPLVPNATVDIEGDVMTLRDSQDGDALVLKRVK